MNTVEIRLNITEQISKTNEAFTNYFGLSFFEGLLKEDLDSLKILQKKATKYYKIHFALSVLLSGIMIVVILLQMLEITHKDLNKAGVLIIFNITYLLGIYRYYKVKVNLEHKIFLISLRNRIDSE